MSAQGEKQRERVFVIYGVDLFVYLVLMTAVQQAVTDTVDQLFRKLVF